MKALNKCVVGSTEWTVDIKKAMQNTHSFQLCFLFGWLKVYSNDISKPKNTAGIQQYVTKSIILSIQTPGCDWNWPTQVLGTWKVNTVGRAWPIMEAILTKDNVP